MDNESLSVYTRHNEKHSKREREIKKKRKKKEREKERGEWILSLTSSCPSENLNGFALMHCGSEGVAGAPEEARGIPN